MLNRHAACLQRYSAWFSISKSMDAQRILRPVGITRRTLQPLSQRVFERIVDTKHAPFGSGNHDGLWCPRIRGGPSWLADRHDPARKHVSQVGRDAIGGVAVSVRRDRCANRTHPAQNGLR